MKKLSPLVLIGVACLLPHSGFSQNLVLGDNSEVLAIRSDNKIQKLRSSVPLFSVVVGDQLILSNDGHTRELNSWEFDIGLKVDLDSASVRKGWKGVLTLTNNSPDTLSVHNLVFLGQDPARTYLTGYGDHWLSRSRLFRPNQSSVPVILPDNAWELGYADAPLQEGELYIAGFE